MSEAQMCCQISFQGMKWFLWDIVEMRVFISSVVVKRLFAGHGSGT